MFYGSRSRTVATIDGAHWCTNEISRLSFPTDACKYATGAALGRTKRHLTMSTSIHTAEIAPNYSGSFFLSRKNDKIDYRHYCTYIFCT